MLARRDNLQAAKQGLSRQLIESSLRLQNATVDMKSLIRALMGSTSERLTEFQMRPRRQITVADRTSQKAASRARAKKRAEEAALQGPNAVATTSATSAATAGLAATAETQG